MGKEKVMMDCNKHKDSNNLMFSQLGPSELDLSDQP